MQSPDKVLSILAQKAQSDKNFKFKRLYRNLYNTDFFYLAYAEMAPKEGNMTAGTDKQTLDGFSIKKITNTIKKLKDFSYQPKPAKRVYIPKKNNSAKMRPLGIPCIEDKMVQYVLKYILEAIYENNFSPDSHGFRPNRSCHTALKEIKQEFKGMKWFVEGDICGFFDNINHHILINIIRRRIADENFIGLIWKFLKAGYLEKWQYNNTFSGTPQGGIISPILANIYLNEFDCYIQELQTQFNAGNKADRKRNQNARRIELQITRLNRKLNDTWSMMTPKQKEAALQKKERIKGSQK